MTSLYQIRSGIFNKMLMFKESSFRTSDIHYCIFNQGILENKISTWKIKSIFITSCNNFLAFERIQFFWFVFLWYIYCWFLLLKKIKRSILFRQSQCRKEISQIQYSFRFFMEKHTIEERWNIHLVAMYSGILFYVGGRHRL